jgi:hypothetical protein
MHHYVSMRIATSILFIKFTKVTYKCVSLVWWSQICLGIIHEHRVDSSRLYRITQRQSNTIIHAGGNMRVNCLSVWSRVAWNSKKRVNNKLQKGQDLAKGNVLRRENQKVAFQATIDAGAHTILTLSTSTPFVQLINDNLVRYLDCNSLLVNCYFPNVVSAPYCHLQFIITHHTRVRISNSHGLPNKVHNSFIQWMFKYQ